MRRNFLVHYSCPATPAHAGASTSLTEEKFLTVEIRDFSTLAERQCVSAHCSCGPLTFDIHGEIIISSSAEQFCPADVDVVLAFLRIYSSLSHELPSAHS
jgi:hypothetical protein